MVETDYGLYDGITQAFIEAFINGRVDCVKFGAAAAMIAPLYDRIFGKGMVSNHLKDDLVGHGNGLMRAAEQKSDYKFVDEMVPTMIREKGVQNIRGKWGEGIVECLWTKRAVDFILRFLEYGILVHTDRSLHDCAAKAYAEVLKPYHGVMVSTIVTLTFNLAPKRENFLLALGFNDLTAAQFKLRPFIVAAKPAIEAVHKVLTENGCDFPDKV